MGSGETSKEGDSVTYVQSIPNHTIDPGSGFLESTAYAYAFDATKKKEFLKVYRNNGLGLYDTCALLGISHHTINKHYHLDPEFKRQFDEAKLEYGDRLEALSRRCAMENKNTIERIFQLKAHFPEKYADQKVSGPIRIEINIDGKLLEKSNQREKVIESKIVEDQRKRVLVIDDKSSNTVVSSESVDNQ